MPAQVNNWSCSACSLAWVLRSTGLDSEATEQSTIEIIGYPENINATYGLMDGSGSQLQRVLEDSYDQPTEQRWITYDEAYTIAEQTCGMLGGSSWYHWVGVRGVSGANIWIANSAPGWMGVWDTLNRSQFNSLGPFSLVALV